MKPFQKVLFAVLLLTLLSPSFLAYETTSYDFTETPIVCYKSQIAPVIDGNISTDWNDVPKYTYQRECYHEENKWALANITLQAKYDARFLYILFELEDKDNASSGAVNINLEDMPVTNKTIVILENGSMWLWNFAMTGFVINWSSPVEGGGAAISHANGYDIYEIALSHSYLSVGLESTYSRVPFNIEYTYNVWDAYLPYGMTTASVGKTRSAKPGLILMPDFYLHAMLELGKKGTHATLNWKPFNDSFGQFERYEIWTSFNDYHNITLNKTVYERESNSSVFETLQVGRYYFKVYAYNSSGLYAESDLLSVTIDIPMAPKNVSSAIYGGNVNLSWPPPSDANSPITEYKIYRGTSPDSEEYLASVNGSVTHYIDSNVSEGTTYYYRVSAVNGVGESNLSEEVSVQIPTPSSAWPQSTLMLAMSVTVLVSAGILVAIFRSVHKNG